MKPVALVVLLVGCAAVAQVPPPGKNPEPEAFRISVDVDLVVLQATVRDHEGHTVMELGSQDFEVFEDDRTQPIRLFRHEDTPVTVGLIIDHSGSMRKKSAVLKSPDARSFQMSTIGWAKCWRCSAMNFSD